MAVEPRGKLHFSHMGELQQERNDIMISYIKALGKYAVFGGRSSRTEFWGFTAVNAIIWGLLLYFFIRYPEGLANTVIWTVGIIYFLITIVPSIALVVRRWHDLGRTGMWVLLNLIPIAGFLTTLIFFMYRGEAVTNQYGRDPLDKKLKRKRKR